MPNEKPRSRLPKASDILADQIRGRILGDGLTPGTSLPSEVDLIEESEFSRSTVREALRLLEAEGLIEIRRGPRGGIKVRHPDAGHVGRSLALMMTLSQAPLWQLFEFRMIVEPEAAAAAAVRLTPKERKEVLKAIDEDMDIVEFHRQIGIWSGNEMMNVVLAAVHDVVRWHVLREALTEEDVAATKAVHIKIARAIAEGKGRLAATHMRKHLESFQRLMKEQGRLDKPIVPRQTWQRSSSGAHSDGHPY